MSRSTSILDVDGNFDQEKKGQLNSEGPSGLQHDINKWPETKEGKEDKEVAEKRKPFEDIEICDPSEPPTLDGGFKSLRTEKYTTARTLKTSNDKESNASLFRKGKENVNECGQKISEKVKSEETKKSGISLENGKSENCIEEFSWNGNTKETFQAKDSKNDTDKEKERFEASESKICFYEENAVSDSKHGQNKEAKTITRDDRMWSGHEYEDRRKTRKRKEMGLPVNPEISKKIRFSVEQLKNGKKLPVTTMDLGRNKQIKGSSLSNPSKGKGKLKLSGPEIQKRSTVTNKASSSKRSKQIENEVPIEPTRVTRGQRTKIEISGQKKKIERETASEKMIFLNIQKAKIEKKINKIKQAKFARTMLTCMLLFFHECSFIAIQREQQNNSDANIPRLDTIKLLEEELLSTREHLPPGDCISSSPKKTRSKSRINNFTADETCSNPSTISESDKFAGARDGCSFAENPAQSNGAPFLNAVKLDGDELATNNKITKHKTNNSSRAKKIRNEKRGTLLSTTKDNIRTSLLKKKRRESKGDGASLKSAFLILKGRQSEEGIQLEQQGNEESNIQTFARIESEDTEIKESASMTQTSRKRHSHHSLADTEERARRYSQNTSRSRKVKERNRPTDNLPYLELGPFEKPKIKNKAEEGYQSNGSHRATLIENLKKKCQQNLQEKTKKEENEKNSKNAPKHLMLIVDKNKSIECMPTLETVAFPEARHEDSEARHEDSLSELHREQPRRATIERDPTAFMTRSDLRHEGSFIDNQMSPPKGIHTNIPRLHTITLLEEELRSNSVYLQSVDGIRISPKKTETKRKNTKFTEKGKGKKGDVLQPNHENTNHYDDDSSDRKKMRKEKRIKVLPANKNNRQQSIILKNRQQESEIEESTLTSVKNNETIKMCHGNKESRQQSSNRRQSTAEIESGVTEYRESVTTSSVSTQESNECINLDDATFKNHSENIKAISDRSTTSSHSTTAYHFKCLTFDEVSTSIQNEETEGKESETSPSCTMQEGNGTVRDQNSETEAIGSLIGSVVNTEEEHSGLNLSDFSVYDQADEIDGRETLTTTSSNPLNTGESNVCLDPDNPDCEATLFYGFDGPGGKIL